MKNIKNKLNDFGIVIVDMQKRFEYCMGNKKELIEPILETINFGKENNLSIFYLEYQIKGKEHPLVETIYEIKKELLNYPKAKKIKKYNNNGFIVEKDRRGDFYMDSFYTLKGDSHLDLELKESKIKNIILIGINRDACMKHTGNEAKKRGYEIYTSKNLMNRPIEKDWFTDNAHYFNTHDQLIDYFKK